MRALLIALLLTLVTAVPAFAQTPTTWKETWQNGLNGWTYDLQNCFTVPGGYARGVCQSSGLKSSAAWDPRKPIRVDFTIWGKAAAGSATSEYFSGLTLWQRESPTNVQDRYYFEAAVTRHVPPFTANWNDRIVGLITDSSRKTVVPFVFKSPIQLGQPQAITMLWQPYPARWEVRYPGGYGWNTHRPFLMDGQPVRLYWVCASVGENTPNNGTNADCGLGQITVTGVRVS